MIFVPNFNAGGILFLDYLSVYLSVLGYLISYSFEIWLADQR